MAELAFEHDHYIKLYLLDGVTQGFKIVDTDSVIDSYDSPNYGSVRQFEGWSVINELISKEITSGKYLLVQSKP